MTTAWSQQDKAWEAHYQSTYVRQSKAAFPAPSGGEHSLGPHRESSYSFTATAALGFRPWGSVEIYLNPEVAQGVPLAGLTGLGGFTNGEIARASGPRAKLYRARAFVRQSWSLSDETEHVESDMNQLAGNVAQRRVVLTAGNLSVLDVFDQNRYAHDPRTQFLNWAFMTHGAFDYPADARGYTNGIALEYFSRGWVARVGRFAQPLEPNQLPLDDKLLRHYGDVVEFERQIGAGDLLGKIRLLAFRNRAIMSRYSDALNLAGPTGQKPDIDKVRNGPRSKVGFGVSLDQPLSRNAGLFARAMWADGETETYAFTEIDRSVAAGLVVKGAPWHRGNDSFGLAWASNALSPSHRQYLAAGGLGFFLGDGRLTYRRENIVETFYEWRPVKWISLAIDWQRIANPAYNADRGPVNVASARVHVEF